MSAARQLKHHVESKRVTKRSALQKPFRLEVGENAGIDRLGLLLLQVSLQLLLFEFGLSLKWHAIWSYSQTAISAPAALSSTSCSAMWLINKWAYFV